MAQRLIHLEFLVSLVLATPVTHSASRAQVPSFPSEAELQGKQAGDLVTKLGKYGETDADWGFLLVPENRNKAESRLLRLMVVRQRAAKEQSFAPIFNLVGGPGTSNVWGSGDFDARFHERNDVVRVGYRGIDGDVELKCPEFTKSLQTPNPLSAEAIGATRRALRSCNERLRAEGIDVDGYNLAEVVEDIEATRKALGYERISFLAVSWGTQIAYAYAMRYPHQVQRMLLIGAGGRARGFDLWDPRQVDRLLRRYAERWLADATAKSRSADILGTIREVLYKAPAEWRTVPIDRDKIRLAMWEMLGDTTSVAQLFDAFASAASGDYRALALLSWAYDEELRKELKRRHGPYHGEFFSKVMSSGLDPDRDWVQDMDPQGAIIGSPAAKLLWGAASSGGWPMQVIPQSFRQDGDCDVETLILMGNLDFSAPADYVERELMPHLKRGRLVVLSDFGHVEFIKKQPEAFHFTCERFFHDGVVDTSKFVHKPINFQPGERLTDQADFLFAEHVHGSTKP